MSIPGYKVSQLSTKDPMQMDLQRLLHQGAAPGLKGGLDRLSGIAGGDESYLQALEAPAYRDFQRNVGSLSSRFSGLGTGARDSSGFQAAVSGAGAEMAENLQSQRLSLQQQAMQQLLGLSSDLLGQNNFENVLTPKKKKKSFWDNVIGIGAPVAGGVIGGIYGGPTGAIAGAEIGGKFGSAFL